VALAALETSVSLRYTHRGDYSGEADHRPVITVEFAATTPAGELTGATRTGVMVDSGARSTLLGLDVAIRLGLDLSESRYPKGYIGGVVPGATLWAAEAEIMAQLCGRWLRIPARFSLSPAPIRGLLGREGVFDRVTFSFEHGPRYLYGGLATSAAM
jgi:hypothetical protein